MKTFYVLRHADISQNSGTGVVAEGVVFDNQFTAMTWLTDDPTVTVFIGGLKTVKKLHGHQGKTEIILEGKDERFEQCKEEAKLKRIVKKHEEIK